MNRADQAPEPSMEELLASIRLIISDADKKGPPQKEAIYPGNAAADAPRARAHGTPSDDVFDLTEELVFPDAQAAPPSLYSSVERRALTPREVFPGPAPQAASRRPAAVTAGVPPSAGQGRPDNPPAVRPDTQKHAFPAAARPIWSGRELPPSPAPSQPAAPRLRDEGTPAKPQARNWPGDIQMPVPDQGPVSLFSTQGGKEPQGEEDENAADRVFGIRAGASQNSGEETAAVAVLAQRLARSAIGVLEASELESANYVDFEHLDAESKAEITEKFADVIECESVEAGAPVQSNPPGSVTGQVRKAEQSAYPAGKHPATETPVLTIGTPAIPEATRLPNPETKPEAAAEPEHHAGQLAPPERPGHVAVRPAPAHPPAVQPLAQVQFVGPAPAPLSAQAGRTLEDAVREMLRPLLVQWLNENMPRILENAIREEIAVRGLLPKSDS